MKANEEQKLMNSIENENWKEVENIKEEKLKYKKYAAATLKRDKRINIRISKKDLEELQQKDNI